MSLTSTFAAQLAEFPLTSTTVKTTELLPTEEQLKAEGFTLIEAIPQASLELKLTEAAARVPFPVAFRNTVAGWQRAFGRMVSLTVTIALQEDEFPLTSVTLSTTEFAPTFVQFTRKGVTVREDIPHESQL